MVDAIFEGHCVVLINGFKHAFILGNKWNEETQFRDATSETVVRGPKLALLKI
ncbi:hypothetical protein ACEQPO_24680 [Bacillus sp. SL00103]